MLKRFLFLIIGLLFTINAPALDLELTQGISSSIPVGIDQFSGDQSGELIESVLKNDLRLSGQFKLINSPGAKNRENSTASWKNAGADSFVSGQVMDLGPQGMEVRFELIDAVNKGRLLMTKSYKIKPWQIRALAHHLSDLVYQQLTGEKGIFSTKIAYILVQKPKGKKRYSLEVADADGFNPQSLLVSSEPIMSPAWSPDGKSLAYVSFERKKAQIYTVALTTGKRRLVTDFSGINGAPAWSPDGKKLAVVLSKSGSPKIYEVDLSTGRLRQLTHGLAIDTEPNYTADGKSLLFTSGRGGSPQIYRLDLATNRVKRVSYDGNYNARASMTSDQKNIIMLHREGKRFNIGVQNTKSSRITPLTFSMMDESPSIAPNNRLILYATRFKNKGVLGIVSLDGRIRMRLPSRDGDVQEPAWSPYLG